MSGPPANPNAWRPSDLEAIRCALLIPVTAPALRAINDAMAQLERSYPEAIPGAKASLDAIAVIDAGLVAGGTPAEPFVIKTTRKAAAGPVPAELPKKKLDVIEYATELLILRGLVSWCPPGPSPFTGTLIRSRWAPPRTRRCRWSPMCASCSSSSTPAPRTR